MTYKEHHNFCHESPKKSDVMPSCTFSHGQAQFMNIVLCIYRARICTVETELKVAPMCTWCAPHMHDERAILDL